MSGKKSFLHKKAFPVVVVFLRSVPHGHHHEQHTHYFIG